MKTIVTVATAPAKPPVKRGRKKAKITKNEEPTEEDGEELARLRERGMFKFSYILHVIDYTICRNSGFRAFCL